MKPKRISWQAIPFLISAPLVGVLVSAPAFGWSFPEWPAVSLEALGALAMIGALTAQDETRR
jgi:hypothetical protein